MSYPPLVTPDADRTLMNAEQTRLEEDRLRQANWRRWGPYLSERQWGTVREDYSATGRGLGLFPARPRPLPRLPLGRGRHPRHLGQPPAAVFRARVLERER